MALAVECSPNAFLTFVEDLKIINNEYYTRCETAAKEIVATFQWTNSDVNNLDTINANDAITTWNTATFDSFVDGEAQRIQALAAYKAASSFEAVKGPIKNFLNAESIFARYNPPDPIWSSVDKLLEAIAPDGPTIDDMFFLTTIELDNKSFLAIKYGSNVAPLLLARNVKLLERSYQLSLGLTTIRRSNSERIDGLNTFLHSSGPQQPYFVVVAPGTVLGYAYIAKDWVGGLSEFNLLELGEGDVWQSVSLGTASAVRQALMQKLKSSKMFEVIERHNARWRKNHLATCHWEHLDVSKGENWVLQRFIVDLVILDMSRFGWSPCWSTPANASLAVEDGRARTFLNDLAEFEPPTGAQELPISQTKAQWKVTKFMHTSEFRNLRRRQFAKQVFEAETPGLQPWLAGSVDDHEKEEAELVASVMEYTNDPKNDIPALCVSFTATAIRLREGLFTSIPTGPIRDAMELRLSQMQLMETIRRFKLIAFKTISVPAHQTLKRPVVDWKESYSKIAMFLKYRIEDTVQSVQSFVNERRQLPYAFFAHAEDKLRSNQEDSACELGTGASARFVSSGMPCGVAVHTFDRPRLFARVRIQLPNEEARDATVDALRAGRRLNVLPDYDKTTADDLFKEWRASEGRDSFWSFENKTRVRLAIRFFKDIEVSDGDVKKQFKALFDEWKSVNGLEPSVLFKCDAVLNSLLKSAADGASLHPSLVKELKAAQRKTTLNGSPLVFAEKDTEIFVVTEIDISRLLSEIPRDGKESLYVPADVEVDKLVRRLQQACPRHRRPDDNVQETFRKATGREELVVLRMDCWVGDATPGEVASYDDAMSMVPIVPYELTRAQLNQHASDLETKKYTVASATPFDSVANAANSLNSLLRTFDPTPPDAPSTLPNLFSEEGFLDLVPWNSLGRVCRIAFELLKGAASYWPPVQYEAIAFWYGLSEGSYTRGNDPIPHRFLPEPSWRGEKRFASDQVDGGRNALLVPYQHAPWPQPNEDRIFADTTQLTNPFHSIGIVRLLQTRISIASYAVNNLRLAYRDDSALRHLVSHFQLAAQDIACCFPRVSTNQALQERNLVAKALFPSEFAMARTKDTVENANPFFVASRTQMAQFEEQASFYKYATVSNTKAIQAVFRPDPLRVAPELKNVLYEMALIAEGIHKANPLLRYMCYAATMLKRSSKYRYVTTVVNILKREMLGVLKQFATEHAAFEDAVRSYADLASIGVSNIELLKKRFWAAYDAVRDIRRNFDRGKYGLLVYLVNECVQSPDSGNAQDESKEIAEGLFQAIEKIMTTTAFLDARPTLNLDTLLEAFPRVQSYTVLAARMHSNAMLACVTSAAPFRDVPRQTKRVEYRKALRGSLAFDTLDGFFHDNRLANFHCLLPTAKDAFGDNGVDDDNCYGEKPRDATPVKTKPKKRKSKRDDTAKNDDDDSDDDSVYDEEDEEKDSDGYNSDDLEKSKSDDEYDYDGFRLGGEY